MKKTCTGKDSGAKKNVLMTSFASWKSEHQIHADNAAGVNTHMLSSAVHMRVHVFFFLFAELYDIPI